VSQSSHLVCPHCDAVNRIPDNKFADQPKCGRCKEPLFTGNPVELTDQTFDRHLKRNDIPLVVDFWAPWCGPCLQMAPAFAAAASHLEPWMHLAKVDTEAQPQLGAQFGIRSIPTLMLFKDGAVQAQKLGAMSKSQLNEFLESNL